MAIRTPLKAIRAKCLDCSGQQFGEVRECPVKNCPLYEYRMGHRPPKDKSIKKDISSEKVAGYAQEKL